MLVQFKRMRGKQLEDVIADSCFLHISEIGPVRDEIRICAETLLGFPTPAMLFFVPYVSQIAVEEFLEKLCA